MIYTKEALEAARMKVVATPDALEAEYIRGWNDALEAVINNFGSVSRETTGHWITTFYEMFPAESTVECSICHEEQPFDIDRNYCPNCGAKMTDERPEDKG